MAKGNSSLKDQISRSSEITISVTGRKSGRTIANPVWFVVDGDSLNLLPVKGSDTQWYKNVIEKPSIQIEAGSAAEQLRVRAVTEPQQVASVVEKFRSKYGAGDVKKYYSKLDVAVVVQLQ